MNNRKPSGGRRPDRSHGAKPYQPRRSATPRPHTVGTQQKHLIDSAESRINFIERWPTSAGETPGPSAPKVRSKNDPFRILIAVHRPRYRGRTERAAAIPGWNVISLLNKQDVVGQVEKGHIPPDIVVMSADFGRQKSFGIFRAIQAHRATGMKIVGLVENCDPDEFGNDPTALCDLCLPPPYKTADLHALFRKLYHEIRGVPAPDSDPIPQETEFDNDND